MQRFVRSISSNQVFENLKTLETFFLVASTVLSRGYSTVVFPLSLSIFILLHALLHVCLCNDFGRYLIYDFVELCKYEVQTIPQ